MRPLVQLLHKTEILGAQRSAAVVAAAASAVWNISAHEAAKAQVVAPPPSPGPSYPLPLARIAPGLPVHRCLSVGCSSPSLPLDVRAAQVIKEHGVEALTEQLQTSTSEDVWQKCAGCLMVLAANSDKVKNLIGEQMGVRALTAIVKQSTTNPPVLKATLGALAVLSSDERNLAYMREEGMEQLIEKFKVKDDRVQMFVKQLKERLYNAETQ